MAHAVEHIEIEWLNTGPWVLGEQFSVADADPFVIGSWQDANGVDTKRLPHLVAHRPIGVGIELGDWASDAGVRRLAGEGGAHKPSERSLPTPNNCHGQRKGLAVFDDQCTGWPILLLALEIPWFTAQ